MLQFGSPIFLWGLPAAFLPAMIHLRKLRRLSAADFPPAFLFGARTVAASSLHARIEDVSLMLLRCAILACVPLAMARPAWKPSAPPGSAAGGAYRPAGEPADVVLVLDDSPSMSAFGGGPRRLLADAVRRIAAEYPDGSRFAGIASSMRSTGWIGGADGILGWYGKLPSRDVSGDLASALDSAASLLSESLRDRRDVFVISDFQPAGLPDPSRLAPAAGCLPDGVRLHIVCVGAAPSDQWAVDGIELSRGVPVAGEPFRVAVNVRCMAGGGRRGLELRINGKIVGTSELAAAHGGTARAEFHARADDPGPVLVEARLDGSDEWPGDDARMLAFATKPPPAVALVLAARGSSQDRAIEAAVAPFGRSAESRTDLRLVPAGDLNAAALKGSDCIVVAGDADPDAGGWAAIRRAVENGAGLLLFAGADRAETVKDGPDAAARGEAKAAATADSARTGRISAAWVAGLAPKISGELSGADADLGLIFLSPRHPILAPFMNGRNGDLASVRFAKARRFDLGASGLERREAATLAVFANGAPAIVEKELGRGRIVVAAFQPDPDENRLADEPAFVVFIHAAIGYLANMRPVEPPRPCGAPIEIAVTPAPRPRRLAISAADIRALLVEKIRWMGASSGAGAEGGTATAAGGMRAAGSIADIGTTDRNLGGGPGRPNSGIPIPALLEVARIEIPPGASAVRLPPIETAGIYRVSEDTAAPDQAADVPAFFLTVETPAAESDLAPSLGPWKSLEESGLAAGMVEGTDLLSEYLLSLRPGLPLSGFIFAAMLAMILVEGLWCIVRPDIDER